MINEIYIYDEYGNLYPKNLLTVNSTDGFINDPNFIIDNDIETYAKIHTSMNKYSRVSLQFSNKLNISKIKIYIITEDYGNNNLFNHKDLFILKLYDESRLISIENFNNSIPHLALILLREHHISSLYKIDINYYIIGSGYTSSFYNFCKNIDNFLVKDIRYIEELQTTKDMNRIENNKINTDKYKEFIDFIYYYIYSSILFIILLFSMLALTTIVYIFRFNEDRKYEFGMYMILFCFYFIVSGIVVLSNNLNDKVKYSLENINSLLELDINTINRYMNLINNNIGSYLSYYNQIYGILPVKIDNNSTNVSILINIDKIYLVISNVMRDIGIFMIFIAIGFGIIFGVSLVNYIKVRYKIKMRNNIKNLDEEIKSWHNNEQL
jgi:hypothetical protein